MSLIECSECKAQISDKADKCPKCGNPIGSEKKSTSPSKPPKKLSIITMVGIASLMFLFICIMMQPDSTKNSKTPSSPKLTKEEKKEQHRIAKHGEKPIDIEYDVKSYLGNIAKDPDSVKIYSCSNIFYNESDGWMSLVDWGAKNSFGGMNRAVNWFVIDKGRIQMKPADAYK